MKSEGLELPLEMHADICIDLVVYGLLHFVQCLSTISQFRYQSDMFVRCCMPASMHAYNVHGYNAAVKA